MVEEEDGAVLLGLRFAGLAAEVEAVLGQIREREGMCRRKERTTVRPPHDIFKRLPGRQDFEYIKVPKKPPKLCFGSKTERKVFPNIPEILKKHQSQDIEMSNFTSPKESRSRASPKFASTIKDQISSNNKVKQ